MAAPFDDHAYSVAQLVDLQDIAWYRGSTAALEKVVGSPTSNLTELLQICHERASNVEKEGGHPKEPIGKVGVYKSTVFGHELQLSGNPDQLWARFGNSNEAKTGCFSDRQAFLKVAGSVFPQWVADGRWPINDVSLYDISFAAAAFFKAAVAKCLLEKQWPWLGYESEKREKTTDTRMNWRILRMCVDGPAYYANVARIPDLLIRRKLLDGVLDNVKRLFEEELCLANKVYRDEFGACFLVPDLAGDADGKQLTNLLQARIEAAARNVIAVKALGREEDHADPDAPSELTLKIHLTDADPRGKILHRALQFEPPPLSPDLARLKEWWKAGTDIICTVCMVRPIAPSDKARERKVCKVCEERREDRSKEWTSNLRSTIWLDEVADRRGRIALIAGRFDLDGWLSGEAIEDTLFLSPPYRQREPGKELETSQDPEMKNPSFARLLRVLRTTKDFWDTAICAEKKGSRKRWRIPINEQLAPFHSYELCSGQVRLSVVYDANQHDLITAENLERAAFLLDWDLQKLKEHFANRTCTLEESSGYGRPAAKQLELTTGAITDSPDSYHPLVEVLSEPRDTLFIVPADRAMDVLTAIKGKCDQEMGKVRDRLPIHLAAIFAPTSTPFSALYDASRRMMNRHSEQAHWKVSSVCWGTDSTHAEVSFENKVTWKVPCVMGSGRHQDVWYPYFRTYDGTEHLDLVQKIDDRRLAGKEVTVELQPSTFDFEFMDSAGERFEISYEDGHRRGDLRNHRPHLIERLPEFYEVRDKLIAGLGNAQIHGIHEILREKKLFWSGGNPDELWTNFVLDAFAAADWPTRVRFADVESQIKNWAETGVLLDALELWLHISKSGKEKL